MAGPARFMADLSNNNAHFDAHAYRKGGHRVVALKATEGVGGRQGIYVERVNAAHRAGLFVVHYHFARPDHHSTSTAEAADFLSYIKPHVRKGDRVALDLEVQPGRSMDLNAYSRNFAHIVRQRIGHKHGWLYSYSAFISEHGLRVPSGWRLWLANYSAPVPHRGSWTHQFTNGISGPSPHSMAGVGQIDVSMLTRRAALGLHVSPR